MRVRFPRRSLGTFRRNRDGGIMILAALALPALILAVGVATDAAHIIAVRSEINALADSAVLTAVSPVMMKQTDAQTQSDVQTMFENQVLTTVPGVAGVSATETSPSTQESSTASVRTATLVWTAQVRTFFASFLGVDSVSVSGKAQAINNTPANIDFYILVDTSPSMALPATSDGVRKIMAATSYPGQPDGCLFACHESSPSAGDPGGGFKDANGQYLDYYAIARANGIELRTDVISKALSELTSTISASMTSSGAAYRMELATYDAAFHEITPLTDQLEAAGASTSNISLLYVCSENVLVCGTSNADEDSQFDTAMTTEARSILPTTAGQGTNSTGDTPQAVIFLLTDGMVDQGYSTPSRNVGPINVSQCDTIKSQNKVRIAVLYTQYLPVGLESFDGGAFYRMLYPVDTLAEALQSCASPGLFYEVGADGDVSAGLQELFRRVVSTSYISQ